MSDLHLATVEALALAIDAKDQTATSHIRRVQVYAAGIAQAMGMAEPEVQGLRTAALLHDIGKLAVPEHILSKPGPLTQEEFQRMQVHPQVGAEIIAHVPFPYPVAPIIQSHHERWDGKGYPSGLSGEAIPFGARILAAVDYFDALSSDRPFHKALSRDEALEQIKQEAGKALDPAVVETLGAADAAARGVCGARGRARAPGAAPVAPHGQQRRGRGGHRRTSSTTSRWRIARSTRSTRSRSRWAPASAWPTRWRWSRRS